MAPTVSPSDLNIIPQDDAGQGCGGTPNSIDQQASEVEPDGDPSLSTKSRGKTAGKSKQATKKERRPRGDPLQPKKSVTRACWADEVQDAIGNYKMRVDPATRDPIIPKGKRRAGTDRVDWRSQLSENPAGLLHRLGYFAGPSAATKRNDLGKELLQKIEQAHGRQFWPCPQTDRYGRNIIDKTEPRFLRQYLQSKLGKGDARIKKIIDDADEYVKDGERHGYLSKYDLHGVDLHWTPPLPASDDDTSSPPATSTTSTQRLASTTSAQQNPAPPIPSTRPALQPSPSRPQLQQAKPPNEDRSDPNIDPELWGVGATTQYSGPTASGAFAGQSMFQAAPVAPMMGTVWSSSLFNSLGPSNHSSTPDYTADRHTMNLSNRRKAREEDKYDDAGDYLRDSTAKRRRDTRNGPQAYTPPSAQGLAAIRASLAAGSARIFAETMNDINQSLAAASTSRRSAKKRKQSDGASDADETAGCGSGPAKKQKITTTDEALQRPHERPQAEQPSKRDSGYNSQEASPPICPANSPSTSSSLAPPPSDDVLAQTQIPANTSAAASSPSGAAMSSTAVARRV